MIVTVWSIFETRTHSFLVSNDWINPLHIYGNQNQYFLYVHCRHSQLFTLLSATRSHSLQWRLWLVSEFPAALFFLDSNLTWTVRQLQQFRRCLKLPHWYLSIWHVNYRKTTLSTLVSPQFYKTFLMNHVRLKRNSGGKDSKGVGEIPTYFRNTFKKPYYNAIYPAQQQTKTMCMQRWLTCGTMNFIIPVYTIKSYDGVRLYLQSFLTIELGG